MRIALVAGVLTSLVPATDYGNGNYWAKPENFVPHERIDVLEPIPLEVIDKAFPDFNCDRVENGRWRKLRLMFEALVSSGFCLSSPRAFLQWDRELQSAESIFGISGWLYPFLGVDWITGVGVTPLMENLSANVSCPLGIANVMAIALVVHLAKVHEKIDAGLHDQAAELLFFQDGYTVKAAALQHSIMRVFEGSQGNVDGSFIWALLPSTRWPILDILAAAEEHILRRIREFFYLASGLEDPPCLPVLSARWLYLIDMVGNISRGELLTSSTNVAVKALDESGQMTKLYKRMEAKDVTIFEKDQLQCAPRRILFQLLKAASVIHQQSIYSGSKDPESVSHSVVDVLIQLFWPPADFAQLFITLDFSTFHIFGFWLQLRRLCYHRLEVHSSSEHLALAFGTSLHNHAGADKPTAFQIALYSLNFSDSSEKLLFLTQCWGARHSKTLVHWLRAARRALILGVMVVMCHDTHALAACRTTHTTPSLCADVRDWPKTTLSKLLGMLFCLWHGWDAMWLDLDTIVLHDPRPFLQKSHQDGLRQNFLLSVESNTWNCINAGVLFMRSTLDCRRYLGHWMSLYLQRPFALEQSVLYLLLSLLPTDFAGFAERNGLLKSSSSRVQALGSLVTPTWGALDSREKFCASDISCTGGFPKGKLDSVLVLHMLSSWPNYSMFNPLYDDVPDGTEAILQALDKSDPTNQARALELLRRSERIEGIGCSTPGPYRSCYDSYMHGR